MEQTMLEKYARLLVKTGLNLQAKQTLVIVSPIECAAFTRTVAQVAYQEGAREVVVNWKDELLGKIRFTSAPDEVFDEFPSWQQELYNTYVKQGAAFLSIAAADPELLKDVDPNRLARAHKASSTALADYRERLMSNKNAWCVASIPTVAWAAKVFPELAPAAAVDKLWDAIFQAVRVNTPDPVAAWEQHKQELQRSLRFLNDHAFRYLRYRNHLGTDLTVELPAGHIWLGGSEHTADGIEFIANMPTEEVFTLPKRDGVNGTVVSSKPLNYHGNLITDFRLTFKDGKIVEYSAGGGYDILKKLLETDDGAAYLGEVALVPHDSPISRSNILFYNTLFDENASCHLAFGKAYPVCLAGGESMNKDELAANGVNDSLVHEDFMIGTPDLSITGVMADGREVPVFVDGNFAFAE